MSDGTAAGTRELADLSPAPGDRARLIGAGNAVIAGLAAGASRVYYYGDFLPDLFESDGTEAGTHIVHTPPSSRWKGAGSGPHTLAILGGDTVAFEADDGAHGIEPWITDGTDGGTRMLVNLVGEGTTARHRRQI